MLACRSDAGRPGGCRMPVHASHMPLCTGFSPGLRLAERVMPCLALELGSWLSGCRESLAAAGWLLARCAVRCLPSAGCLLAGLLPAAACCLLHASDCCCLLLADGRWLARPGWLAALFSLAGRWPAVKADIRHVLAPPWCVERRASPVLSSAQRGYGHYDLQDRRS